MDRDSIVVYSDYVCPFCYLGRQSLEQYQQRRDRRLSVEWHPFDLRSDRRGPDGELDLAAEDGKSDAYYEQARENVRRLQERYDVEMTTEMAHDVDSFPAQVASHYVQRTDPDRWPDFDDLVFDALWVDGRDVGDRSVVGELAEEAGLDPAEIRAVVDDDEQRERVFEQFEAARRAGVTGVPTFVYDGRAARGAVPPEHFRRLVDGATE
ncbi:MAG: DsbA family protein [Haloarculaceae archaeon]